MIITLLCTGCGAFRLTGHSHHDEDAISRAPDETRYLAGQPIGIYIFGTSGPPILLLHELPGLTHECIRLAELIQGRGYRVYVPLLFGAYGESKGGINQFFKACHSSGGFHCFSEQGSAEPLNDFIRRQVFPLMKRDGGQSVVIGMCLTGHVGVTLLNKNDEFVRAAVMSQPALPLALTSRQRWATGLSESETNAIRESGKPILAFRFTRDAISPPERMVSFEAAFPGQITVCELESAPGNGNFTTAAHAVLTEEYQEGKPTAEAVGMVLDFLDCTLKSIPGSCKRRCPGPQQ